MSPAEMRPLLREAARTACRDEAHDLQCEQDALRLRRQVEQQRRAA